MSDEERMTPEQAVIALDYWLRTMGLKGVTHSPRGLYWTAKNGRRWGWHMSNASVPIAENVIAVLATVGGELPDRTNAALALMELTQLAIQGAGGHKGDHGTDAL
jgi:hypothetical protein